MTSKSGLFSAKLPHQVCQLKVLFVKGREKISREKTQAENPHEPQGQQYQARGTEPQEDRDKNMALPRKDLQALCSKAAHGKPRSSCCLAAAKHCSISWVVPRDVGKEDDHPGTLMVKGAVSCHISRGKSSLKDFHASIMYFCLPASIPFAATRYITVPLF